MYLVAAFKGMRWGAQLNGAVDAVLAQVQLTERATSFAHTFSGGMKRRLSVALSTVGDVRIIFFDEPTTGLDPLSRRRVWETIHRLKKNRVVVLTTHNMEEADSLGDTVMILHGGKVRALGDPLFLKQTYGNAYQVDLVVGMTSLLEVEALIKTMLPGSQVVVNADTGGVTVSVVRDDILGLPRLFTWLENIRRTPAVGIDASLGLPSAPPVVSSTALSASSALPQSTTVSPIVREWRVSNTTLEQVFLLLCVQNTELNYVDPAKALMQQNNALCPMCRTRPRNNVTLRRWKGIGGKGELAVVEEEGEGKANEKEGQEGDSNLITERNDNEHDCESTPLIVIPNR